MKFSSARAAIMWAWWMQFDCLIGTNPLDSGDPGTPGNISAGLSMAMDIKKWLERSAHKVGLESIGLILLSVLPQEEPVNLLPWQQRKVDDALDLLEDKLDRVGWLEKNSCISERELL